MCKASSSSPDSVVKVASADSMEPEMHDGLSGAEVRESRPSHARLARCCRLARRALRGALPSRRPLEDGRVA